MNREPVNTITAAVGAEIRRRRLGKKMSQRAFAKECGVSFVHLCNVERGLARLSYDRLYAVAGALGCKIGTLFRDV